MSRPTLSPASPSSSSLRNISTPVQVEVSTFSSRPMISTGSPTLMTPVSIRPVTTVPRPVIENTSSTGIRKGFSFSRSGSGMYSSTAFISSMTFSSHFGSPLRAPRAEPRMMGALSPSYSYLLSRSRTSISTRSSISGSSTMSHLFRKTTIFGTFT